MSMTPKAAPTPVRLGLRENRLQFALLVIVNVCVGALVGLERTTVPLIGTDVFGLTSDLAVFSFIVAFGVTKALTNLAAGALTARFRRKQLLVAAAVLTAASGLLAARWITDGTHGEAPRTVPIDGMGAADRS
ncbi:hypothetical protein [Streptomyces sp. S.PNR 29]|uniref:hypothetical protein n=1 Tax=Streptomyces sp. S.PNR 29 TaxID=2973805 RepID=UPI0025B0BDB6|nr:hypothetical protein [Streptomyces sp. S.PNR 29]MDN0199269.1 hypothetical protein [Streptomyces sp. S.PNR 29]